MSDPVPDLVIEMLAQSEAELIERVASLESDVQVYHDMTVVAFDIIRDLTEQNRGLVITRARLRDDVLTNYGPRKTPPCISPSPTTRRAPDARHGHARRGPSNLSRVVR